MATALFALPASGETWETRPVKVPGGTIKQIRMSETDARTFVRADGRWLEITACPDHRFCFTPRRPQARRKAPGNGLPDGVVASRPASKGPVSAWYAQPSQAYRHGILGDAVEAELLLVRTADGKQLQTSADEGHVFEDLTPRLADLDGDGQNEVIAIRTDFRRGAMIAVYGVAAGKLRLLAATRAIGRPNRWRNPALVLPDPSGKGMLIAEVVTPHIGGTLRLWSLRGSAEAGYRLEARGSARGFSNHAIGSRQLNLMAHGGGGLIGVPSGDRTALRIMQAGRSVLSERASVSLPGRIEHAIGVLHEKTGPVFLVGLDDGSLHAVSRPNPDFYCVTNSSDERLLLVAETASGERRRLQADPHRDWCIPRRELKIVWAFADENAVEGCSHPVGRGETVLVLEDFSEFDNCRWTGR
jgi:hypothetical protein